MSDERLKKNAGSSRAPRQAADRAATQNRAITDDERVAMFRQSFYQSALPDLPKIDGWHCCWLTTTNPRDSIAARMRLGYEPIRPEDVPGWEYVTVKTGEYAGLIGVNEMLAFKLPQSLYERFMAEAHYDAPLREEERLQDVIDQIKREAESKGGRVMVGEGSENLVNRVPKPEFSGE